MYDLVVYLYLVIAGVCLVVQLVGFLVTKYHVKLPRPNLLLGIVLSAVLALMWPITVGIIIFQPDVRFGFLSQCSFVASFVASFFRKI